jgi:hypothetical protein
MMVGIFVIPTILGIILSGCALVLAYWGLQLKYNLEHFTWPWENEVI